MSIRLREFGIQDYPATLALSRASDESTSLDAVRTTPTIVQPGDTLAAIAARLGIALEILRNDNPGVSAPAGRTSAVFGAARATGCTSFASAQTRWARATNVVLKLRLFSADPDTNVVRADLELTAATVETRWAEATNFYGSARWLHSITNPIPLSGRAELQVDDIRSRWGGARQLHLAGSLLSPANLAIRGDESWAWWAA